MHIKEFGELEERTLIRENLWLGAQPSDITKFKFVFNFSGAIKYWIQLGTLVVIRPFNDTGEIPDEDMLHDMARQVSECSKKGPTLVHCAAGINRSSFVLALALIKEGMNAADAIAVLREKRGNIVLSNKTFEKYLLAQKNWR